MFIFALGLHCFSVHSFFSLPVQQQRADRILERLRLFGVLLLQLFITRPGCSRRPFSSSSVCAHSCSQMRERSRDELLVEEPLR